MPQKNDNLTLLDNTTPALLEKFTVPRPSVGERMAAGKALRDKVPREKHGEFRRHPTRQDPVSIIEEQAKTRLPFLVPIRHSRMLASPFAFLRGAAAVMSADLAHTPTTGMTVQACGDMHVANFGVFASAERTLVFGINDFDETLPGAWEWDLKRLAASAVVCGRFLGADRALCEESARAVVKSYRKRMREYAKMSYLDVWYARIDESDVLNAQPSPSVAEACQTNHGQGEKARPPAGARQDGRTGGQPAAYYRDQTLHRARNTHRVPVVPSRKRWGNFSRTISNPWRMTGRSFWPAIGSSMWPAKWLGSVVSAPAAG